MVKSTKLFVLARSSNLTYGRTTKRPCGYRQVPVLCTIFTFFTKPYSDTRTRSTWPITGSSTRLDLNICEVDGPADNEAFWYIINALEYHTVGTENLAGDGWSYDISPSKVSLVVTFIFSPLICLNRGLNERKTFSLNFFSPLDLVGKFWAFLVGNFRLLRYCTSYIQPAPGERGVPFWYDTCTLEYSTGTWTLRLEVRNSLSGTRLTVGGGGVQKHSRKLTSSAPRLRRNEWIKEGRFNHSGSYGTDIITVPYRLWLGTCLPALFAVFAIRKVKHYSALYISEPETKYCHDKIGFARACIVTCVAYCGDGQWCPTGIIFHRIGTVCI